MRYLIINGDDFGMSRGINRGILTAHRQGIVGSTSLLVDAPASEDAATLAATAPALSVGLHADLMRPESRSDANGARLCLERQVARFGELTGRLPTHIDSHHDVHRDPALLSGFTDIARAYGIPLRRYHRGACCSKFYGQWDGEMHPEQVSVAGFERILDEVGDGVTELACHPGYVDGDLRSSYRTERELELQTLCDPAAREAIARRSIVLIGFREARALLVDPAT